MKQIGYTFLPCVLAGLSKAPQFVKRGNRGSSGTLWADDVDCVVVPANACGGEGTLALCRKSGRKVMQLLRNKAAVLKHFESFPCAISVWNSPSEVNS